MTVRILNTLRLGMPFKFIILLVATLGISGGCGNAAKDPESLMIKDLDRAIEAIEDRREAELRMLEEYDREIRIMSGNLDRANSDGMREKIEGEIEMRRSARWKSEKNIANQDSILKVLYFKKDSILDVQSQKR